MNRFLILLRRIVTSVLFFAALVFIWHYHVQHSTQSALLLPDPSDVWAYLVSAVKDHTA